MNTCDSFEIKALPNELQLEILKRMNICDAVSCRAVCKSFKTLAEKVLKDSRILLRVDRRWSYERLLSYCKLFSNAFFIELHCSEGSTNALSFDIIFDIVNENMPHLCQYWIRDFSPSNHDDDKIPLTIHAFSNSTTNCINTLCSKVKTLKHVSLSGYLEDQHITQILLTYQNSLKYISFWLDDRVPLTRDPKQCFKHLKKLRNLRELAVSNLKMNMLDNFSDTLENIKIINLKFFKSTSVNMMSFIHRFPSVTRFDISCQNIINIRCLTWLHNLKYITFRIVNATVHLGDVMMNERVFFSNTIEHFRLCIANHFTQITNNEMLCSKIIFPRCLKRFTLKTNSTEYSPSDSFNAEDYQSLLGPIILNCVLKHIFGNYICCNVCSTGLAQNIQCYSIYEQRRKFKIIICVPELFQLTLENGNTIVYDWRSNVDCFLVYCLYKIVRFVKETNSYFICRHDGRLSYPSFDSNIDLACDSVLLSDVDLKRLLASIEPMENNQLHLRNFLNNQITDDIKTRLSILSKMFYYYAIDVMTYETQEKLNLGTSHFLYFIKQITL